MPGRDERVALNEVANRDINEMIEAARTSTSEYFRIMCECGRDDCDRQIAISTGEYEQIRGDARLFAVQQDHVLPEFESVAWENERFAVVRKRNGTPADVAESLDPRQPS